MPPFPCNTIPDPIAIGSDCMQRWVFFNGSCLRVRNPHLSFSTRSLVRVKEDRHPRIPRSVSVTSVSRMVWNTGCDKGRQCTRYQQEVISGSCSVQESVERYPEQHIHITVRTQTLARSSARHHFLLLSSIRLRCGRGRVWVVLLSGWRGVLVPAGEDWNLWDKATPASGLLRLANT